MVWSSLRGFWFSMQASTIIALKGFWFKGFFIFYWRGMCLSFLELQWQQAAGILATAASGSGAGLPSALQNSLPISPS